MVRVSIGCNDIRFGEVNYISQALPVLGEGIFHCMGGEGVELLCALQCYILS